MRKALSWVRARNLHLVAALLLSLLAIFFLFNIGHADPLEGATNFILTTLIRIIQWLMELVGALVLLLVSLLVSAAKYNTFTNAYPVQIGWVLVRDTVNMFFIVVLLLIAFGTIIGYEPFNYKKHLPYLLLMAVMINFSKTIVGVLIDFSQVIMLTFVNGFQAAAGGNFINALKLTKVTKLSTMKIITPAPGSEPQQTIPNLLMASLLGLGMLVIAASVILLLLVYLVVRIVGLWITLILSPIAFFALALPEKIGKAVGMFTNEWWKRLSALLTGGPIVAFFLWLSLATVQGNPDTLKSFYQSQSDEETKQVAATITEAGEPAELSSFIVAIVMLLMGLSAAISITGQVSAQALPAAKFAGALAIGATKRIAKTGVRAGTGAAKGTARYLDRTTFAKGGVPLSERVGKKFITRAAVEGSPTLAKIGAGLLRRGAERRGVVGAELEEMTKGLNPEDRLKVLQSMKGDNARRLFPDPYTAEAVNERALKITSSKAGIRMEQKNAEQEWLSNNAVNPNAPTEDERDKAHGYAEARAKRAAADANAALQEQAQRRGDEDTLDKLKAQQSEDPSLFSNFSKLDRVAGNKVDDFKQAFKGVKTEGWQDSATFLAYAKAADFVDDSGKLKDGYEQTEAWKELVGHGGNRAKYVQAHAYNMKTAGGQAAAATQLNAMKASASDAEIAAAQADRYSVSLGRDGQSVVYANVNPGGSVERVSLGEITNAPRAMADFTHVAQDLDTATRTALEGSLRGPRGTRMNAADLDRFAQRFDRPLTPEAARIITANPLTHAGVVGAPVGGFTVDEMRAMQQLQTSGASASATFKYNVSSNAYRSVDDRAAHEAAFAAIRTDLTSGNSQRERDAMRFFINHDIAAIKNDGPMMEVVAKGIEGQLDEMRKRRAKLDAQGRKQLDTLVETMAHAASRAAAKTGALTPQDERLVRIGQELATVKTWQRYVGEERPRTP